MISNKFGLTPFGGKEPFHIPITTTGAAFTGRIESFALPYTRYVFSDGQVVDDSNVAINVTFSGAATRNHKFYVEKANAKIVSLESQNLAGGIPAELGNLSNLTLLYLYSNQLTGSIPAELGNLSNLIRLYLNANELTGSIPTELGNLSKLANLFFHENELTGSIPTELGNLSNLILLYLNTNDLTGNVPVGLGNLSKLTHLYLYSNQLTSWNITNLPLTCTNLQIQNNLLSQAEVDKVIASVYNDLSSRSTTGVLNVGGTGNAAPSATGITQAAAITTHGWTVTHNV